MGKLLNGETGRRSFLEALLGTRLGTFALTVIDPVVGFLIPPEKGQSAPLRVVAAKRLQLPPNSGRVFGLGTQPAIVFDTASGDIGAFAAVCTHLGYTVQFPPDMQKIWCVCHDDDYDLFGKTSGGHLRGPLSRYAVNSRGNDIVVSRV